MIERSCVRSEINLPVLENTQRHIGFVADLAVLAQRISLLGDPTRLKILASLAYAQELCVCDLADILQMETSSISHQLRKLRDGGLVANRRSGALIYYSLKPVEIQDVLEDARELLLEEQGALI